MRFYWILFFGLFFSNAFGQKKILKRLDSLLNNLNPIAVPTIQNAPETSWNFGAGITYYFNAEPTPDTLTPTRSSSLVGTFNYSLRRQLQTEVRWQVFTKNERIFYRGAVNYADFFDKFWGIGNNAPDQNLSELSFRRLQIQANALRRVAPNLFAGVSYQASSFGNFEWFLLNKNLQLSQLEGSAGSGVSGAGPIIIADFRDNPFSATRGFYAELSAVYYRAELGSTHRFDEYFIDLRHYQTVFKKHVLAFQGVGNFMSGSVPFREKPRLGGAQIMRGYFNGRKPTGRSSRIPNAYLQKMGLFVFCQYGASSSPTQRFFSPKKQSGLWCGAALLAQCQRTRLYSL
jgi:Omp85 superfamily domain